MKHGTLPTAAAISFVVLMLYFAYLVLKPFLVVLFISFIFAVFLNPVFEWLLRKSKKPLFSALVSVLGLLVFILTPLFFVAANLVSEARDLTQVVQENPEFLDNAQSWVMTQLRTYGVSEGSLNFDFRSEALGLLRSAIQNIGGTLILVGSVLISTFFILITTTYFLIGKNKIGRFIEETGIIPFKYYVKIKDRAVELINGVVRGNLLVTGLQIITGTLGFLIFGVPAPLLLGFIYGILSLLPAVGTLLVWIPTAIYLFFANGPVMVLFFLIWFGGTNILIDNLIAPKIIGGQTRLHQLIIIFSVVGGVQQFGIVGLFLGPVIIALAFVAIEIYKEMAGARNTT